MTQSVVGQIPQPLNSRLDFAKDLSQTLLTAQLCSIGGIFFACLSLVVKALPFSCLEKVDQKLFNVAKINLKGFGGGIPSLFKDVIGIISLESGRELEGQVYATRGLGKKVNVTLHNSGGRGLLSSPLIQVYEGYMQDYQKNIKNYARAMYHSNGPQKIAIVASYFAMAVVAPRLAAVAMLIALTVTRVLDLGIGCVFAPFAFLLAPLELHEFNEITFKALQGLTLLYDYFLLLHNLLHPGGSDMLKYVTQDGQHCDLIGTCWDLYHSPVAS